MFMLFYFSTLLNHFFILLNHFFILICSSNNYVPADLEKLISKIITVISPILIAIGIGSATLITGINFLKGIFSSDYQDIERKKRVIKNVVFTWIFALLLSLTSTLCLIFKNDIINNIVS